MPKQPRSLSGRVAAVTGGARGIGAATARALAARGVKVAIGDLDLETARATAEALGSEAIALELDVTDRPGFTAFLDEVESRLGPLDILVNNAGIMPVVRLDEESDASITRQLEINLHGVIHGTAEAVRRMRPRGHGSIVQLASTAGKAGFPGLATYCATKHAVVGFSEAARLELLDTGIELHVVMPGVVDTELASGIDTARGVRRTTPEEVARGIVEALGSGRFEVYVPREAGVVARGAAMLPRVAREALGRAMGIDRLIIDAAGSAARAGYEARAAASAPAAEDGAPEPEASSRAA